VPVAAAAAAPSRCRRVWGRGGGAAVEEVAEQLSGRGRRPAGGPRAAMRRCASSRATANGSVGHEGSETTKHVQWHTVEIVGKSGVGTKCG